MTIPFALTDLTATVYLDGEPFTVDRTTNTFTKLVEALNTNMSETMLTVTVRSILANYGAELEAMQASNKGRVEVTRRAVTYDGRPVNEALQRRVLDIAQAGLPIDPWIAFVDNLYSNPADHAREELYLWLEKADLPITEDGHFLAYKKVDNDLKDIYTHTFDNSPGQVVTMPGGRPAVDPVRDNTCSRGLHFCSKEYLPSYGVDYSSRVVLVKINPADVVSIPSDYSNTKGRTWKYEVLSEVAKEEVPEATWAPVVANDGSEWYRKDPFGNLIQADPYSFDDDGDLLWDDDEVLEDKYGVYTLGVYPESVKEILPHIHILYPDRIGEAVRIYEDDVIWDFDADVDEDEVS